MLCHCDTDPKPRPGIRLFLTALVIVFSAAIARQSHAATAGVGFQGVVPARAVDGIVEWPEAVVTMVDRALLPLAGMEPRGRGASIRVQDEHGKQVGFQAVRVRGVGMALIVSLDGREKGRFTVCGIGEGKSGSGGPACRRYRVLRSR